MGACLSVPVQQRRASLSDELKSTDWHGRCQDGAGERQALQESTVKVASLASHQPAEPAEPTTTAPPPSLHGIQKVGGAPAEENSQRLFAVLPQIAWWDVCSTCWLRSASRTVKVLRSAVWSPWGV